jgi:hypothetical protein
MTEQMTDAEMREWLAIRALQDYKRVNALGDRFSRRKATKVDIYFMRGLRSYNRRQMAAKFIFKCQTERKVKERINAGDYPVLIEKFGRYRLFAVNKDEFEKHQKDVMEFLNCEYLENKSHPVITAGYEWEDF